MAIDYEAAQREFPRDPRYCPKCGARVGYPHVSSCPLAPLERTVTPIDYEAAQREFPRLKAALTRAKNSGDPIKVLSAVEKAYDRFDAWGAWPDQWALWRMAAWDAHIDYLHSDEDDRPEILSRFVAALER